MSRDVDKTAGEAGETGVHSVGAVVLTWKDTAKTLRCLASILASDLVRVVVVIDNESEGGLRAGLPADSRVVLKENSDNLGFAAAVNEGMALLVADGCEDILVINNDAVLEPQALSNLHQELHDSPGLGLIAPVSVSPEGDVIASGGRINRLTWRVRETGAGRPDFVTWACVLLRRSTLERVGYLDERYFMYWEDVDYSQRMQTAHVSFRVSDRATVLHEVSSSHSRAGNRIVAYSTASFRHYVGEHGGVWFATGAARVALRMLVALLSGRRERFRAIKLGWEFGRNPPSPASREITQRLEAARL